MDKLEELEKLVKQEYEATEEHLRLAREHNAKAAIHFYRLGKHLLSAKEVLGHGNGKMGKFRAWHINLGIDKNKASQAMRLVDAVDEDGGEEALAGLNYWTALKHYQIIPDRSQQPSGNMWASPAQYNEAKRETGYLPGPQPISCTQEPFEPRDNASKIDNLLDEIEEVIPEAHLGLIQELRHAIRDVR